MRVTKEAVIRAASNLADEKGVQGISLKETAERVGIRTPSLYNHIGSLEELLREVAHQGMREMNRRMAQAALGISGDAAIKETAVAYLDYMVEHPGVYEAIQWAAWNGNGETGEIFGEYCSLFRMLLGSCGFEEERIDESVKLMAGMLHGYAALQLRQAFLQADRIREEIKGAVDTVLLGMRQKEKA